MEVLLILGIVLFIDVLYGYFGEDNFFFSLFGSMLMKLDCSRDNVGVGFKFLFFLLSYG